jgi:hypothetical protein
LENPFVWGVFRGIHRRLSETKPEIKVWTTVRNFIPHLLVQLAFELIKKLKTLNFGEWRAVQLLHSGPILFCCGHYLSEYALNKKKDDGVTCGFAWGIQPYVTYCTTQSIELAIVREVDFSLHFLLSSYKNVMFKGRNKNGQQARRKIQAKDKKSYVFSTREIRNTSISPLTEMQPLAPVLIYESEFKLQVIIAV